MRGFSPDAQIIADRIRKILEKENDWVLYETIELKAGRQRYISNSHFPFVIEDALTYLILCDAIISKTENDQVYYKLEK